MGSLAIGLLIALAASGAAGSTAPARSDTCGGCHRDIHRMWRGSAHARSLEGPVFLDGYRATEAEHGSTVSRLCLDCHAPLARIAGDVELRQRTTWEGVSCEVCHSLVAVDFSEPTPRPIFDFGRVKRGPIRGASTAAHAAAYSELHTTAAVCAPCHEYVNAEGVPILTTFSEWKESSASRSGKSCQACHMETTRVGASDPRTKREPAPINLHEVPGGHSLEQLHRALGVGLVPRREKSALRVDVTVSNRGAGHAVPTGMPGRKVHLILTVRSSDGGFYEARRVYARTFRDGRGETVAGDGGCFAPGVREDSDTRIRPDERRTESFRFPVASSATVFVDLKLHYEHRPVPTGEGRTWLTFYSETRTLAAEVPPSP
jgi:hypothetical protein